LDDAINVAKNGIAAHPEYVGGYMAAGRAYFEKGMKEDCRDCLERVVLATPENLMAQKILSQIYLEQGDISSAIRTLKIVELLNPEDEESRVMLANLSKSSVSVQPSPIDDYSQSRANDELESAETFEMVEADQAWQPDETTVTIPHRDPLATATLAELYVSQGFLDRAMDVYRGLIESGSGSDNEMYRERLKELEKEGSGTFSAATEYGAASPSDGDKEDMFENPGADPSILLDDSFNSGGDGGVIAVLECWLDNIKRGRYAAEGDTPKYS
jgi:tetratricopeptide (TPR) repeat protein